MTAAALTLDDLPESLRQVAEEVGMDGAMTILQKFGGIRLFVPKKIKVGHMLVQNLGEPLARHLSRVFGGETLTIPRAARALLRVRNEEIVTRYDAGVPVRTLAAEYRLTERQIYGILNKVTV